jgi:ribosomal protein L11 methylase PrmA
LADPTRRWPALDIVLRAATVRLSSHAAFSEQKWLAEQEGQLLAFLDDYSPTAITAPPGGEDGWLVTASPDVTPAWLAPPDGDGTPAATPRAWRVFFASPEARATARTALAASDWARQVDLADVDVEDEGWAERSQAALRAIRVGGLIIAPPWDVSPVPQSPSSPAPQPPPSPTAQPTPNPTAQAMPSPTAQLMPSPTAQAVPSPTAQPTPSPTAQPIPDQAPQPTPNPSAQSTAPSPFLPLPRDGAIGGEGWGEGAFRQVIIEPSMGFGTGHHESTRLCLQALQAIDLSGRRVLDLGTGSGVLAIAAAVLGAESVLGLDDDRDAVEAARGNVRLNQVDARVSVEQADLARMTPQAADVVLANLTGAILRRYAAIITSSLAAHGLLIVSGFTKDERIAVAHELCQARALTILREDREDGWMSLTLQA